jgi:hypothetical protein
VLKSRFTSWLSHRGAPSLGPSRACDASRNAKLQCFAQREMKLEPQTLQQTKKPPTGGFFVFKHQTKKR